MRFHRTKKAGRLVGLISAVLVEDDGRLKFFQLLPMPSLGPIDRAVAAEPLLVFTPSLSPVAFVNLTNLVRVTLRDNLAPMQVVRHIALLSDHR